MQRPIMQVFVSNVQEARYHVIGHEMQVVNIELKPSECKSGVSMMRKRPT